MSDKDKCPACNGFGVHFPFPAKRKSSVTGELVAIEPMKCQTCQGSGEIDDKKKVWIKQGEMLRDFRRYVLGMTLRETCRKFDIDPSYLSRMERGVQKPRPPKELFNSDTH